MSTGLPSLKNGMVRTKQLLLCAEGLKIFKSNSRQIFTLMKELLRWNKASISYPNPNKHVGGRPSLIDAGSEDEAIIEDLMEQCLGFCHTLKMVNKSGTGRGVFRVGGSVVISVFRRMVPVIMKTRKRMQGVVVSKKKSD